MKGEREGGTARLENTVVHRLGYVAFLVAPVNTFMEM